MKLNFSHLSKRFFTDIFRQQQSIQYAFEEPKKLIHYLRLGFEAGIVHSVKLHKQYPKHLGINSIIEAYKQSVVI